ncbi:preprotein translocase subunit SecG [Nitrosospira sp. NpAV]|uniref:preprotein translocase subunit SecG n=1 Tax=Nitrosospira sp. NpAV TaxID=58133 RepID=UPI0005A2617C|nr:preprotein translocase subunit SecG [Nitrosospira sp. NpAV]KIO48976.1 preprotein translocase subunit SecG [Nitrosospira sp. NpAV]
METLIWVVHVLSAISVIVLVLLQHGKGADMGAAFGSGSSGSLFGASGSANFLSRTTGALAAVFFITSLGLTYLSSHKTDGGGVMDKAVPVQPAKPIEAAPAAPAEEEASRATEIPK